MVENRLIKMNILYIFNDTSFGGAGLSLVDTLISIKNLVTPIVVIREESMDVVKNKFDEIGVRYYKISFSTDYVQCGCSNKAMEEADIKQNYLAALQLLRIIKKEKIQLIHINSSVSSFAAIAALIANVPYIWHIRELMEEQFRCEFINMNLKQSLYMYADRLIAISDYVKQSYFKKFGVVASRVYNGLTIEKYVARIERNAEFAPVFLVVGIITPEKGQWDAICATERLIRQGYSDIELIIVGDRDTSYTWALKKYIKQKNLDRNISIIPFCEDLSDLRKKASYAITCSQNEALGRVTIEAMLAGNFVIGARSGGTIEIIGDKEERGFLYELHNSEELAKAMIRAIKCPKEIKTKIICRAQAYAEEIFDSKQYCKRMLDLYNEVIASFKPKSADGLLGELKEHYSYIQKEGESGIQKTDLRYQKSEAALTLAVKWLKIKQDGHNLSEYFIRNHIYSIAIYGMAALGCRLYDELEQGPVEVKYLLDRNPRGMEAVYDFATLDDEKMEIDAIVVTVARAERQIINEIKNIGYSQVIGLSEILASDLFLTEVLQEI